MGNGSQKNGAWMRNLALEYRDLFAESQIAPESVGAYEPPKRRFLHTRQARIVPVTRAWRLGVLLIDEAGALRSAGATLRAHEPPPILGYTAESARQRDELRHAAIRGGFAEGETVHYDTYVIDCEIVRAETGPISLRDGDPVVRWHLGTRLTSAIPLEKYLQERAELLIHPPQRAT